jgi:CheY-like chemotaxis protein
MASIGGNGYRNIPRFMIPAVGDPSSSIVPRRNAPRRPERRKTVPTSPSMRMNWETDMIMLLTHQTDLREQIAKLLKGKGHAVCVPPHRTDVNTEMKQSQPDLVVLDMYVDNPAGRLVFQNLREQGYMGIVIVLSGPSQAGSIRDSTLIGITSDTQASGASSRLL